MSFKFVSSQLLTHRTFPDNEIQSPPGIDRRADGQPGPDPDCARRRPNLAETAAAAGDRKPTLEGEESLSDEERARLRDQARRWLRAELAAWGRKIDSASAAKVSAENALKRWLTDPDLAGLREPDLLDKLSVAESRACREMWKEIEAQLERARRRN